MDREVDIFTAVRQIQIRRPECVSTVVGISYISILIIFKNVDIIKKKNIKKAKNKKQNGFECILLAS